MKAWGIIWAVLTLAALIGLLIGNNWMLFAAVACGIMTVACLADDSKETQED